MRLMKQAVKKEPRYLGPRYVMKAYDENGTVKYQYQFFSKRTMRDVIRTEEFRGLRCEMFNIDYDFIGAVVPK